MKKKKYVSTLDFYTFYLFPYVPYVGVIYQPLTGNVGVSLSHSKNTHSTDPSKKTPYVFPQ